MGNFYNSGRCQPTSQRCATAHRAPLLPRHIRVPWVAGHVPAQLRVDARLQLDRRLRPRPRREQRPAHTTKGISPHRPSATTAYLRSGRLHDRIGARHARLRPETKVRRVPRANEVRKQWKGGVVRPRRPDDPGPAAAPHAQHRPDYMPGVGNALRGTLVVQNRTEQAKGSRAAHMSPGSAMIGTQPGTSNEG